MRGVPVLASPIAGSVGVLGRDYQGYFPMGDTRALTALLNCRESDPGFLSELRSRCSDRAPLFDPVRERQAWDEVLEQFKLAT
jgi:glycosyltransferase involved in cell wall biosynthesis